MQVLCQIEKTLKTRTKYKFYLLNILNCVTILNDRVTKCNTKIRQGGSYETQNSHCWIPELCRISKKGPTDS